MFEELFNLFDKNISDYVDIVPLETWYQFYFPDGKIFNYGGSLESTLEEIEKFEPEDKQNYLHLLDKSKALFKIGFEDLADEPFHKFSKMVGVLPDLIRLKSFKTVWGLVSSHLKSPYMQQAFSIQSLLVGGNPFDTTSIYSLIHYLEREWGVHFAMGGTGSLTKAFEIKTQVVTHRRLSQHNYQLILLFNNMSKRMHEKLLNELASFRVMEINNNERTAVAL